MAGLSGLVKINGTDIWDAYHAFLCEEKDGGHENLNAIMARGAMKSNVSVNIREEHGEKYSADLKPRREARDMILYFAITGEAVEEFLQRYDAFMDLLETGDKGWLNIEFPTLRKTMRVFVQEYPETDAISNLWVEGKQAGAFKVKFRVPGGNS